MAFDINGAKASGYSDDEIYQHLTDLHPRFDAEGARQAGYSATEINEHLASAPVDHSSMGNLHDAVAWIGSGSVGKAISNVGNNLARGVLMEPEMGKEGAEDIYYGPAQAAANTFGYETPEYAARSQRNAHMEELAGPVGRVIKTAASSAPLVGAGMAVDAAAIPYLSLSAESSGIANTAKASLQGGILGAGSGYTEPVNSGDLKTAAEIRSNRAMAGGAVGAALPVVASGANWLKGLVTNNGQDRVVSDVLKSVNAARGEAGLQPITADEYASAINSGITNTQLINNKYGSELKPTTAETLGLSNSNDATAMGVGTSRFENANDTGITLGKENSKTSIADTEAMGKSNQTELGKIAQGGTAASTNPELSSLDSSASNRTSGDVAYKIEGDTNKAINAKYDTIPKNVPVEATETSKALDAAKVNPNTSKTPLSSILMGGQAQQSGSNLATPVGLTSSEGKILEDFTKIPPDKVTTGDLVKFNMQVSQIKGRMWDENIPQETKDIVNSVYRGIQSDLENSPVQAVSDTAKEARDYYRQSQENVFRQQPVQGYVDRDTNTVIGATKSKEVQASSTRDVENVGKKVISTPENVSDFLRAAAHTGRTQEATDAVTKAMYADLSDKVGSDVTHAKVSSWIKDNQAKIDAVPGFDKGALNDVADALKKMEAIRSGGTTLGSTSNQQVAYEAGKLAVGQADKHLRALGISAGQRIWQNLTNRQYNIAAAKMVSDPQFAATIVSSFKNPTQSTLSKALSALASGGGAAVGSKYINSTNDYIGNSPTQNTTGQQNKPPVQSAPLKPQSLNQGDTNAGNQTNVASNGTLPPKSDSGSTLSSVLHQLNPISEGEAATIKGATKYLNKDSAMAKNIRDIPQDERVALESAGTKYGVNMADYLAIRNAESSVNVKTKNGPVQMTDLAWKDAEKAAGRKLDRNNPHDYAEASMAFIKHTRDLIKKPGQGTPGIYDTYIAFNAGVGGYKALMAASPNAKAVDVVGTKTANGNPGYYYNHNGKSVTVAQVLSKYRENINRKANEVAPGPNPQNVAKAATSTNMALAQAKAPSTDGEPDM